MLQQTQVATVLSYYPRFLARFPDVKRLAAASLDDVLGLWSGLGYYSRARNLHACARAITLLHGGEFPAQAAELSKLPGIGRSTAAAITSVCFGERVAILDGNVKRVLTRALGFSADLALSRHEKELWAHAESLLPDESSSVDMPRYTQGMMDLGATVCTARQPMCGACPLGDVCVARRQGSPEKYPVKSRKLKRSAESIWMLWATDCDGSVLLQQRPTPGVWAGLYCFALFDNAETLEAAVPARHRKLLLHHEPFKHVLTHKDLYLHPVGLKASASVFKEVPGQWFSPEQWPVLGLPAPVRKLLAAAESSA